jgi:iron complex outermembrane receptor protein
VRAPDWEAQLGFDYDFSIKGYTLTVANENQYSSNYRANLGRRSDFEQSAFFKTDLSLTLKDSRNRWEFAIIGKNLTDKITTHSCSPANIANGAVLGGQITGSTTRGPAGVDELLCFMDRGRETWLRVTFRPLG